MDINFRATDRRNETHLVIDLYSTKIDFIAKFQAYLVDNRIKSSDIIYCKIYTTDYNLFVTIDKKLQTIIATNKIFQIFQKPLKGQCSILIYINSCPYMQNEKIKINYHRFQNIGTDIDQEIKNIFIQLNLFLKNKQLTLLDNTIRSWIYINDIDNNYATVVKQREKFFAVNNMTKKTRYLASTGIGAQINYSNINCQLDLLTYQGIKASQIKKLSNYDIMPDTHDYNVHFERGINILLPNNKQHLYISGTASITPDGKVAFIGDIKKQTHHAFFVFFELLKKYHATKDNLTHCIIYLRNKNDYQQIETMIKNIIPNIPYIIVEGYVCRPTWLIEIEGMAIL